MSVEELFIILFGLVGVWNLLSAFRSADCRSKEIGTGIACIAAALVVAYLSARL